MIEYYVYETNPPTKGGARRASTGATKKMAKKKKKARRGPGGRFLPKKKASGKKKSSGKRKASSGPKRKKRRKTTTTTTRTTRSSNPPRRKKRRKSRGGFPLAKRRSSRRASNPGRDMIDIAWQVGQGGLGLAASFSAPMALAKALRKPQLAQGWSAVGISAGAAVASSALVRLVANKRVSRNVLIGGLLGSLVRLVVHVWPKAAESLPTRASMPSLPMLPAPQAPQRALQDYVYTGPGAARVEREEAGGNYLYDYVDTGDELDDYVDTDTGMAGLDYLTVGANV